MCACLTLCLPAPPRCSCFGLKFNYKVGGRYVLGTYAALMVLVMLMEFGAAISLFTFVGKLDEFGPAQQYRDNGIFLLTNTTFTLCCFNSGLNPNRTWNGCWLADNLAYPCDSVGRFNVFLADYVEQRIQPVAGVALFLCFLQLFTAITACCAQCNGRKTEAAKSIGGPLSYDGLYSEGEETYSGYGYDSYVKTGQARAGGAPGATAPRAPAPGGGPRGPAVPPRPAAAPGGGPPRPAAPGGPAKPPA